MIDVDKLPNITIDLSKCLNACEIKSIMKKAGIKYYCYAFIYKSTIMKYGMSADNDWMKDSYGERIYRQAFQIPGWPKRPSPKSAGSDMLDIIKHFPNIHKSDVCIKVWDMTMYPFAVKECPKDEVFECEKALLDLHEKQFRSLPIGNIRDERLAPKKARVTDQIFNSMFDIED
jgi:hypothetical protein